MKVEDEMSRMGLGTGRLASLGAKLSRSEADALILSAIDNGARVIDTADTYGSGDSERTIGRGISGRRQDCFLITKAGFPHMSLPAFLSPVNQIGKKFVQKVAPSKNFSKPYLLRSVERSLKRLGTDHVDAFLLHEVKSADILPESWEALELIRSKGMSRLTGISTSDPRVLRDGLTTGQVQIVETPVSLLAPSAGQISSLCASHGVPLVANEVLKPRKTLDESGDIWREMLGRHGMAGVSAVHLLVAYAASQPAVKTVLIGTRSPSHLRDALQGLEYADAKPLFEEMRAIFS